MSARGAMTKSDTASAVDAWMVERYRAMPPAEKIAIASRLGATVLQLAYARVRTESPEISDDEADRRVRALIWPAPLHAAFFAARARRRAATADMFR
jgi:preprotein translocase subunit SecD